MATASSRHDYLEEARPPEDPVVKRKYFETTHRNSNHRYYNKRPCVADSRKSSVGVCVLSPAGGVALAPEPEIGDSNAGTECNNNFNEQSDDEQAQLSTFTDERNSNTESEHFKEETKAIDSKILKHSANYIQPICSTMSTSSQTHVIKPDKYCATTGSKAGLKMAYGRRPISLPPTEQQNGGGNASYRKRASYHQDVEEALSSLLWQPYEYRTQSDSSDTLSSLSIGSSSSTSLSMDTTAKKNKGALGGGGGGGGASLMPQSFTDEFLNLTTSSLVPGAGAYAHIGNSVDPNLSTVQQQMVSNLMVLDAATVGNPLTQYAWSMRSHGYDGGSTLSQVDSEHSRVRELATWGTRLPFNNNNNNNNNSGNKGTITGTVPVKFQQQQYVENGVACGLVRDYMSACCDNVRVSGSDIMRVEIPGSGPQHPEQRQQTITVPDVAFTKNQYSANIVTSSGSGSNGASSTITSNNALLQRQHNVLFQCSSVSVGTGGDCVSIQTVAPPTRLNAGDATNRSVHVHQGSGGNINTRCTTTTTSGGCTISSDMIPSNITSVVSANVVGLPVHSRSSSNLSSRTDTVQPNHPRSVSDTANVFVPSSALQLANHIRSSSNLASTSDRNSHSSGLFSVPVTVHARNPSLSGPTQARGASEPVSIIANTSASISQRCSSVPHNVVTTSTAAVAGDLQHVKVHTDATTSPRHTATDFNLSRVPPLPNVSNVNVNFYRAVPVNVVSNVPTIQCLNSVEDTTGNNVSNVHIVQAMPSTATQQVHVQTPTQRPAQQEVRTRTFTSTEAQTDDTAVGAAIVAPPALPPLNREQRRRERRERRHQRRLNSSNHQHQSPLSQQQQQHQLQQQQHWPNGAHGHNDRLPDLLNSHLPPPYSTLPGGIPPPMVVTPMVQVAPSTMVASPMAVPPNTMVPFHPGVVAGQVPLVQGAPPVPVPAPPTSFRFPFPTAAGFRRCRSRLGPRYSTEEHQPKSCCGFLVSRPGSLRWFIALIALVAVCCVLVGTVLGAMRPAGRDHLTVSLLMIGVGIVLVTVSGVAWRLTSHDAPSCRAMLGLESSDTTDICTRRFVPRLPPSYGRPHHPYAAMIYPEFQYRPPPPSYQASMQEYRLRLLLLDRGTTPQIQNAQHTVSPPPTYRSHAGSLLRAPLSNRRDASQSEYSCPPSYRSRSSSNRPQTTDTNPHSREQSLSLSESNHDGSVVNVVNILANQEEEIALENMTLDSLKIAPENEIPPLRMLLKSSSGSDLETTKDGNLVTIVQKADQNPVIVTVSGSQMSTANPEVGSSNQIPSEMEILAHL